jgi:hypothetical protein
VPHDAWHRPPLTTAVLLHPGQKVQPHLTLPQVSPAGWVSWQEGGWLVMAAGTRAAGSPCGSGSEAHSVDVVNNMLQGVVTAPPPNVSACFTLGMTSLACTSTTKFVHPVQCMRLVVIMLKRLPVTELRRAVQYW